MYICPQNNVIDKRTDEECLISLYKQKVSKIQAHCKWTVSKKDIAYQLNSTTFLLYTAKLDRLVVKCDKGNVEKRMRVTGLKMIHLEDDCKAYTTSFNLIAT